MECFVYGTLTDRETATTVLDSVEYRGPATLTGLHRVDGDYPTLLPGGAVSGRILVTDDEAALDSYEGVDRGLYARVTIPYEGGETVDTYVGNPARLGLDTSWPGSGSFEDRVREYLDDETVVVEDEQDAAP
jgi:gamma-glutamylaminecyclotransferase